MFKDSEDAFERLRMHYYQNDENNKQTEEDDKDDVIPDLPEAYELPPEEAIDSVGLYLKEMASVPLLNMEQEVALAKRIEAGKKARRKVKKDGDDLAAAKRHDLDQVIEDGRLAREHLIKANTRLVVSIAKK